MIRRLLMLVLVGTSCGANGAVDFCGKYSKAVCEDRENCDMCYCSFQCGPRKKKKDDTLIYIPNDKNKIYCYCKQRDVDYFEKNGCNVIEAQR